MSDGRKARPYDPGPVDPEIAELEASARKPVEPVALVKLKPCGFCKTPIYWKPVDEGGGERNLPFEEDGQRHVCQEYAAARHSGQLLRKKAAALYRALLDMYPDLGDEP